jgi:transposase
MTECGAALQGKNTSIERDLHASFELGDNNWKLTFGDGRCAPKRYTVKAGDMQAVSRSIAAVRSRLGLSETAPVHSCYEAGRDGWWLHRWLIEQGIDNIVVDAASIEVNRRMRRAKSDRIDGDKLLTMLMRYRGGESRVWSVVRAPSPQQEDERWLHRELLQLAKERNAHGNRIRSYLVMNNLRVPGAIGGPHWNSWWCLHREQLLPRQRALIERECERLQLVNQQRQALARQQRQEVLGGEQPKVAQLSRLRGIGIPGAWLLVKEIFGWRQLNNRRQVGGCLGMVPTPYDSGDSHVEQGVSKTGNTRARSLMVELAWLWLRLQPQSQLTQWFNSRFAHGSSRMRRIGIVALARKLAIALWHFLEHGVIPEGALLKTAVSTPCGNSH